jgi:hypothetical protein
VTATPKETKTSSTPPGWQSAEQRRRLDRQVVRPVLQRLQRREVRWESLDHKLEETLGLEQVLEPVLSVVNECGRRRELSPRCGGHEDLSAVRSLP